MTLPPNFESGATGKVWKLPVVLHTTFYLNFNLQGRVKGQCLTPFSGTHNAAVYSAMRGIGHRLFKYGSTQAREIYAR